MRRSGGVRRREHKPRKDRSRGAALTLRVIGSAREPSASQSLAKRRALSTPPTIVIKIAELVEAALHIFRFVPLFLGYFAAWHPAAPFEVPSRVVVPTSALKTAPEALIGLRLDDGDARVSITGCTLAFDIALGIVTAKLE
jgi:hypothetical protein